MSSRIVWGVCATAVVSTLASIWSAPAAHAAKEYKMSDDNVRTVDPAPFRDTATPFKPTWCGKVEAQGGSPGALGRSAESWFKYGGDTEIANLAAYLCDAPDDPNVQRQAGYIIQAWMNWSGLSQADATASFLARVDTEKWHQLRAETCAPLVTTDEDSEEAKEITNAYRAVYGCPSTAPAWISRKSLGGLAWHLDREADPPELLRAYLVLHGLASAERVKPGEAGYAHSLAFYALYGNDARRLERKRFDQELEAAGGNDYARWVARETFSLAQAEAKGWAKVVADATAKDADLKKALVDVPEAAWKEWVALRKQETAVFDEGAAFDAIANGPSLSAAKGCADKLRPHVARLLAARKPADLKAAEEALTRDAVGGPLFERYTLCEAMEKNTGYATILYGVLGHSRGYRGPRTAVYFAVVEAVTAILADRPKFILAVQSLNPPGYSQVPSRVAGLISSNTLDSEEKGVIAAVKNVDGGVLVTFKKESYTENDYDCKPTNRVYRVLTDGTVEYDQDCKKIGSHKVDTTAPSVVIPTRLAAGLAKGKMLAFKPDHGQKSAAKDVVMGVPLVVYDSKKMTKVVAVWGFAL